MAQPMHILLEGCRLKVLAAQGHIDRLYDSVEGMLKPNLRIAEIEGQANSQRTKYVFRVKRVAPLPILEWGIALGDSVHCLRSSLDQLAYSFAQDPSKRTAYPICLTEKEWVTEAPSQYWSIIPGMLKLIDKTQPYHRAEPKTHPLAILRTLSNFDKHRAIPTIALVPDDPQATVNATAGIERWDTIVFKSGAIYKKGAVIADCKIVASNGDTEPDMDVSVGAAFDIAFDEIPDANSIYRRLVSDVLHEIGEYVVKIINVVGEAWNAAVVEADAIDHEAKAEWKW